MLSCCVCVIASRGTRVVSQVDSLSRGVRLECFRVPGCLSVVVVVFCLLSSLVFSCLLLSSRVFSRRLVVSCHLVSSLGVVSWCRLLVPLCPVLSGVVCLSVCCLSVCVCLSLTLPRGVRSIRKQNCTCTQAPYRGTFTEQFGTCAPGCRTSFNTQEANEWKPNPITSCSVCLSVCLLYCCTAVRCQLSVVCLLSVVCFDAGIETTCVCPQVIELIGNVKARLGADTLRHEPTAAI